MSIRPAVSGQRGVFVSGGVMSRPKPGFVSRSASSPCTVGPRGNHRGEGACRADASGGWAGPYVSVSPPVTYYRPSPEGTDITSVIGSARVRARGVASRPRAIAPRLWSADIEPRHCGLTRRSGLDLTPAVHGVASSRCDQAEKHPRSTREPPTRSANSHETMRFVRTLATPPEPGARPAPHRLHTTSNFGLIPRSDVATLHPLSAQIGLAITQIVDTLHEAGRTRSGAEPLRTERSRWVRARTHGKRQQRNAAISSGATRGSGARPERPARRKGTGGTGASSTPPDREGERDLKSMWRQANRTDNTKSDETPRTRQVRCEH
jgi:hypothetical protein